MSTPILLLVVEDETLLHIILKEGLGAAGFELLITSDAASAISELDADAARFSAILTDIRLGPGATGWQVAARARELVPAMPIVYMSGDSSAEWASKGVPGSVMVPKPFVVAQIVTAVATLLNKDIP